MDGWDFAVVTFENSSVITAALSKPTERKLKDVLVVDDIRRKDVLVDGGRVSQANAWIDQQVRTLTLIGSTAPIPNAIFNARFTPF